MCMLIMCLDMSFTIVYHPVGLVMVIVARLTFSETVFKREVMAHCFALHFGVMRNNFLTPDMTLIKCCVLTLIK